VLVRYSFTCVENYIFFSGSLRFDYNRAHSLPARFAAGSVIEVQAFARVSSQIR